MRETTSRALDRLRQERGETRPEPVVAIDRLGGGVVLCPVADLELSDGDDDLAVTGGEWLASDAAIDLQGVR